MSSDDIVFYVPVHSNFSQVEHTAAFLLDHRSKLFIYQWNTAIKQIVEYYSQKEWSKIEGIFSFSVEQLVECLQEDTKREPARKVVVLLTASPNYSFGTAQKLFFTILQKHFPVIKDIFFVGHCLFGCQSCGMHEHSVPVYFTRFIRGQLSYTTKDIKNILYQQMLAKQIKRKLSTVLICPSVGPLSFLFNDKVIDALIAAQQNLHFVFMVKLHNFCYLPSNMDQQAFAHSVDGHPLSNISDVERANVEKLKKHFVVIDQSQFTILPMLQAFDVIISDVDSSVTFESLYFWPKVVCAYHLPKQELPEQKYLNYLNLFEDELSLTNLLTSIEQSEDTYINRVNSALPSGREYFKSHYGEPNGHEVQKVAQLRGWSSQPITPSSADKEVDSETIYNDIRELISTDQLSMAPDYLAMGLAVPNSVVLLDKFIQLHKPQLESIDLPVSLWKMAFEKLGGEVFDAGSCFELVYNDEGYKLRAKADIPKHGAVFLVDHAWTTDFNHARQQLAQVPALFQRLASMFDLDAQQDNVDEDVDENSNSEPVEQLAEQTAAVTVEENTEQDSQEDLVNQVWDKMWHYNQTYKVMGTDDPVWYVMDEVGSAISHSDDSNSRCMPFIYVTYGPATTENNNATINSAPFSLLWPIKDIKQGEFISRDFYPQRTSDPLERAAHLVAFGDLIHQDKEALITQFEDKLKGLYAKPKMAPPASTKAPPKSTRNHYKVFTDTDLVAKNLTCPNFEVVNKEEDADIIWLADEYKYFSLMKENQFVNQFPNENRITFKHLMPQTVYNLFGFNSVNWLPLTFDMESQLPEFIAEYHRRQNKDEDNTWMVKPWNLGRSLDIYISNNLDCLIRLSETGPKVVTKYIHNPILYEGRKFDLRFIVLLKSVDPLEVYMYNFFWIRLANNTYSLDNFEIYEKHFTVMNYTAFKMQQLHYKDFIANIEKQYPGVQWGDVQHRINKMTKEVFAAAAADPDFGKSHQSRGMYGLDVMLDQGFIPQLLEINFSPDTTRACNYDPPFYNNLFSVLFLNKGEGAETAWGAVTDISDL